MDTFTIVFAFGACASLWILCTIFNIGRREPFLPPGPPTLPILGNLLSFPTAYPWFKFTTMAREFGDVYSLKMTSGTVVILSSAVAVREIMEKNSRVVSDRPVNFIAHEITSGRNLAIAPYGVKWRHHRRCAQEVLTLQACRSHLKIQQAEATQLMYDILTKPQGWYDAVRRLSVSVILSILYGHRAPQLTTPEVVDFAESVRRWIEVLEPGAHPPVDLIPILKLIPERWASWKTEIKVIKRLHTKLYFGLLKKVERRLNQGITLGCFMEDVIERAPGLDLNRDDVGDLGATLVEAGADSTASFLHSLVLALVNFPEVQRLAQEEIDLVVGDERSPLLDDIERLPYIQAVIKEVMRWRPITPIAIPHASTEDVSYREYIIPKGSTIIQNNWAILHDPNAFKDPSVFNPGRWLTDELAFDRTYDLVFGSARRVCPGLHLAKNSMNINTMNLIWGFKFSKSKDPLTKEEKVYDLFNFTRGIATSPNRFECAVEARSAHRAELIKREFLEASTVFEQFELDLNVDDREFVTMTRKEVRDELSL